MGLKQRISLLGFGGLIIGFVIAGAPVPTATTLTSEEEYRTVRTEQILALQEILHEEGRRIRLPMLDISDEIQTFTIQKRVILHNGQIFSPEWAMLELLTEKHLEARVEVRFAELRLASSEGTQLAEDAKAQLDSARQIVEVYEAETISLSEELHKKEANYQMLRHMQRTLKR